MSPSKTTPKAAARNDKVWQIGNTGFRNPERLTAVTRLLARLPSPLWTPGLPPSKAFVLAKETVAKAARAARETDPEGEKQLMRVDGSMEKLDGVGKALAACHEFGLMKPLVQAYGMTGSELFTERGKSFLSAHTDRARRVVFARALASYEVSVRGQIGRPLQRIAQVFLGLEAAGHPSHLTAAELGWCVLPSPLLGPVEPVIEAIVAFRARAALHRKSRESRADCMKRENMTLMDLGIDVANFKRATLLSYADVTARHLLFTGLFSASSPRTLQWDRRQQPIWEALAAGDSDPWTTPAVEAAMRAVLEGILGEPLPPRRPIISGLERLDARETTHRMAEVDADAKIADIFNLGWRGQDIPWGENAYPVSELRTAAPAAEWALTAWVHRALARSGMQVGGVGWRGRADVVGRPERCAPGGDADAILDTATARYVLEATLLTHSRQEACEGESVRRHVASVGASTEEKSVWGIFAAPAIDDNTLLSFMPGGHFTDSVWRPARVIPFDFSQLIKLQEDGINETALNDLCAAIWAARPVALPPPEQPAAWRAAINALVGASAPASPRPSKRSRH